MNILNNFLNFYNDRKELMVIQKANDKQIEKLSCKDILVNFLLFERNKTREQIDNASKHSLLLVGNYFTEVNDTNRKNLNYLSKLLETNDDFEICKKLDLIYKNKLKNYSDVSGSS
jgi:hypothetical protein